MAESDLNALLQEMNLNASRLLLEKEIENYVKKTMEKEPENVPKAQPTKKLVEDGPSSSLGPSSGLDQNDLMNLLMGFINQKESNELIDLDQESVDDVDSEDTSEENSDEDFDFDDYAKNVSLLDMDPKLLEKKFKCKIPEETPKAEEPAKTEKRHFICKFCKERVAIVNNDFPKALAEHRVTPFHVAAEEKLKNKRPGPRIIVKNENGEYYCTICKVGTFGRTRKSILVHCTTQKHTDNIKDRFPGENIPQQVKPKNPTPRSRESKTKKNMNKLLKTGKMSSAMDMACLEQVSSGQVKCKLCNELIPEASNVPAFMFNVLQHTQGSVHTDNLAAKKKRDDEASYKFICLPCSFDGYNREFCERHMFSARHKTRVQELIGMDAGVPVNFDKGVLCSCGKYIFGTAVGINQHCSDCNKKNRKTPHDNFKPKGNRGQPNAPKPRNGPKEERKVDARNQRKQPLSSEVKPVEAAGISRNPKPQHQQGGAVNQNVNAYKAEETDKWQYVERPKHDTYQNKKKKDDCCVS